MMHSNNARRVRLWIEFKELSESFDIRVISYPDLQSQEFVRANPLKKVPAFISSEGDSIFESYVIMQYLEDKFGHEGQSLMLDSPE
jgi:glutathione S-transferase